jgi:hypothetical protein
MAARLLVRLLAVLAFAFTMSVAAPAQATTLTVSITCSGMSPYPGYPGYSAYSCTAWPSGGTGSYTTYTWTVSTGWYGSSTYVGSQTENFGCKYNTVRFQDVMVTDSSGATASASSSIYCTP